MPFRGTYLAVLGPHTQPRGLLDNRLYGRTSLVGPYDEAIAQQWAAVL